MREFFDKPAGKAVAIALGVIGLVFAGWMIYGTFGPSDVAKLTRDRVFIDASTGKPFDYTLKLGDKFPIAAPSGNKTGYPAELCYWTKDGKVKTDPTAVVMNSLVGKPEPTFCPDCGRLVVGHNPVAVAGATPPPTEKEYAAKASSSE